MDAQEIVTRAAREEPEMLVTEKPLGVTADGRVVHRDDPESTFLLVGKGGKIPATLAHDLGIKAKHLTLTEEERQAEEVRLAGAGVDGKGNVIEVAGRVLSAEEIADRQARLAAASEKPGQAVRDRSGDTDKGEDDTTGKAKTGVVTEPAPAESRTVAMGGAAPVGPPEHGHEAPPPRTTGSANRGSRP